MQDLLSRIKNLRNVSFVKQTAFMQVGSVFMTGVSILGSIIFARVLLPEKYGLYVLAFAFSGLILLLLNWGVDRATLVLLSEAYEKRDKKEVLNILVYFIKTSFFVVLIFGGGGILLAPFLASYFYGDPYLGEIARIIVLSSMFAIFYEMTSVVLQTLRRIKSFVFLDNFKNLLRVSFGVLFVFSFGVLGVVAGQLLAFVISFIVAIWLYVRISSRNEILPGFGEIFSNLRKVKIRRYFNFGFSIALNQNITRLYSILPIMFLGMFFSSSNVGYFNIAFKYITLPLILVSPISQLLSVRLPQLKATKSPFFYRNFLKASLGSGVIAFFALIPALLLAPFLIELVYGEEYLPSIRLVYYLAPFTVFSGFVVGLGSLFRTLNKMKAIIVINVLVVLSGVYPAFYLIKNFGLVGISIVTVVWFFLSDLISFLYIRKFIK